MKVMREAAKIGFLWTSGAWVYFFWMLLRDGQVIAIEPNRLVLVAEFCLSILLSILALIRFMDKGGR